MFLLIIMFIILFLALLSLAIFYVKWIDSNIENARLRADLIYSNKVNEDLQDTNNRLVNIVKSLSA